MSAEGVAGEDLRIAVLAGGLSLERTISVRSGEQVVWALAERGHDVRLVDINDRLRDQLGDIDIAVMTVHGAGGEDGLVPSILELEGIPFTGPTSVDCRLSWDKGTAKAVLARAGVHVPRSLQLSRRGVSEFHQRLAFDDIVERLGVPFVVKPARGGSAMGVSKVTSEAETLQAVHTALSFCDDVLIEQHIEGIELACAVATGYELPVAEIGVRDGAYDFEAHYTPGLAAFSFSSREERPDAWQAAETAWTALGGRDYGRVDIIEDHDGRPWVLEVAASPGLTRTSVWPQAVVAAGLELPEVWEGIVTRAHARGSRAGLPLPQDRG